MTTHELIMELNWGSKTAPVLPIHSAFSPSTSHTTTSYWSSDPSAESFIPSLPHLLCTSVSCLDCGKNFCQSFPQTSILVFQNWILTPLKYILPEFLQYIIHPFKASHRFPIFWQRFKSPFCLSQWCCSLMNSSCVWSQCSLPLLQKSY